MSKQLRNDQGRLFSQLINVINESIVVLSTNYSIVNFNEKADHTFRGHLRLGQDINSAFKGVGLPYKMSESNFNEDFFKSLSVKCKDKLDSPLSNISWELKKISDDYNEYYLLIGNDVSGENQLKRSYQRVTAYLESVVANMPGHVFWKDVNSVYLGCNDRMAEICGLNSSDEIIGKTDRDLVWANLADEFVRDDQEVIKSGIAKSNIIEKHHYADDHDRTMLTNKVPLRDEMGEVIGVLGMAVDITEQKHVENILTQEKRKAESASKAKTEFIANMSHDIRTPITGMLGLMQGLIDSAQEQKLKLQGHTIEDYTKEELYDLLRGVSRETESNAKLLINVTDELLQLCNEILDVARLESGKLDKTPESFDIHDLIQHNVSLLQATAKHQKLDLKFHIDDDVPRFLKGLRIYLDRVLLNLISNALKFTKEGFVKVSVRLLYPANDVNGSFRVGDTVRLEIDIEDTGIGIPEEKHDSIFEHFSRLTSSYEGIYKGSGLGLYTVKRYLEVMRGSVTIDSEVGKGTHFILTMPFLVSDHVDRPRSTALPEETKSIENSQKKVGLKRLNVLVVEDNQPAAFMVKKLLENMNYVVELADSGEIAYEKATNNTYDLILMDVGLPDKNGLEITKEIRVSGYKNNADIPIVALTGHAVDEKRNECLAAGMNDILTKPANDSKLRSVIDQYVLKRSKVDDETPSTKNEVEQKAVAIIDWEGTTRLVGGSKDFAKKMLKLFMEELAQSRVILDTAYSAKDLKTLRQELHKLLGGLSYIALPRLKTAVENFQTVVKADTIDEAQVMAAYHKVQQEIKAFCEAYETMK